MDPSASRGELTPAALLRRLPDLTLDIDADDNPLTDARQVELRHSILAIAGMDHVAEIALVGAVVARLARDGGRR
jgi:hypothetical protein